MQFKYYNLYKIDEKAPMIMDLLFGCYVKSIVEYEMNDHVDHGTPKKYLKIETVLTAAKPSRKIYDKSEIKQIYKSAK